MISRSQEVFGAIVTEALIVDLMPWPCPSYLGPGDRYRLEELLAATGLSLVYRATDLRMSDRGFSALVAVKIARTANQGVVQEGLAIRRISHRNVLAVFDRGIIDDCEYTVTELVEGGTLDDRTLPMPAREAAEIMVKVARGMQAAHTAGVFHLDLKPANILLTKDGEPKVADFGYGRIQDQVAGPARGNLAFMSPEQYTADENALTFSADIYSLGGVLYHLLTGNYPHGDTPEAIAEFHRFAHPVRPPTVDDRALNLICAKAMERLPADRYQSAGELAHDLESWLRHEPIRWMRPSKKEKFTLAYRRNPKLMGAIAIAAMFFIAAVWLGAVFNERELKRDELTDAKTKVRTKNENDRMVGELKKLAQGLFAGNANDFPIDVFVLKEIYGFMSTDPEGETPTFEGVCGKMKRYIEEQEVSGRKKAVHTAIAYAALGMLLIECDRWDEAEHAVGVARGRWQGMLDADDPYWLRLNALEFLSTQGKIATVSTTPAQRKAVIESINSWKRDQDPEQEMWQLGANLCKRIEKQLKLEAANNK